MPKTDVIFYQDTPDNIPFLDWLMGLPEKVRSKCREKIQLLEDKKTKKKKPATGNK